MAANITFGPSTEADGQVLVNGEYAGDFYQTCGGPPAFELQPGFEGYAAEMEAAYQQQFETN